MRSTKASSEKEVKELLHRLTQSKHKIQELASEKSALEAINQEKIDKSLEKELRATISELMESDAANKKEIENYRTAYENAAEQVHDMCKVQIDLERKIESSQAQFDAYKVTSKKVIDSIRGDKQRLSDLVKKLQKNLSRLEQKNCLKKVVECLQLTILLQYCSTVAMSKSSETFSNFTNLMDKCTLERSLNEHINKVNMMESIMIDNGWKGDKDKLETTCLMCRYRRKLGVRNDHMLRVEQVSLRIMDHCQNLGLYLSLIGSTVLSNSKYEKVVVELMNLFIERHIFMSELSIYVLGSMVKSDFHSKLKKVANFASKNILTPTVTNLKA